MNRTIAILAVIAAVLLLAPYLGISLFGSSSRDEELSASAPNPATPTVRQRTRAERPKGKQTMVEDILEPAARNDSAPSSQNLSDIENLLKSDGEDK